MLKSFHHDFITDPALTDDPNKVKKQSPLSAKQLLQCLHEISADTSVFLSLLWQGPCRKLLTTLIKRLDEHLFDPQYDIYMPNCDRRGFFRKKQVRMQTSWITKTHRTKACTACILIYQKWSVYVFCWCSAGRLEGSGVASAGVWIRMVCQSHQTLMRRGAWLVKTWKTAQSLDFRIHTRWDTDEGITVQSFPTSKKQICFEIRGNFALLRPLLNHLGLH